ncbi:hypothetical protein ACIP9C_22995, partial [Lysinibacillus sp. NPDC093210]|uniref:hypothetical protein n=1 Tax=Lysinibacillus sp. NPDC093210 TaxID=3364133 RepID=UPI0037F5671F
KEYTVSLGEDKIGTFKGIAAVVPTKIEMTTASIQGVIGNEVTLKAQVTVPEGQDKSGIPVTFNIVNNKTTNEKIEKVAYTNADGVASYSYTRYYDSEDTVAAYSINRASVVSSGKVYWADKIQLAVSEITTGNELANNAKKSYKVTGAKNTTYYIAIKENIKVAPDKITNVFVQNHNSSSFVTPYELTTGRDVFATVQTNANGEATFTIYGSNLSATPIVYLPSSVNAPTTPVNNSYSKLALQAEAPTVKFARLDRLAISVVAEGVADSAESFLGLATVGKAYNENSIGGRTYTVTVTDKDGKLAPEGTTAYVAFEDGNINGDVYFTTAREAFSKLTKGTVKAIKVGKEGKATFRVAGHGATTFVKPTVFLNTAGKTSPVELDKADIQVVADVTYFKPATVSNAKLEVTDKDGREIKSATVGTDAYIAYQAVDQNGFPYRPNLNAANNTFTYELAFDVSSTFGNATVKDSNGTVLNAFQNLGSTKTYKVTSDSNGKAVVRVTTDSPDTVTVNVTGGSGFIPTQAATVTFTRSSTAAIATGNIISINKSTKTFVIQNAITNAAFTYSYDSADVAQYQITGTQVDYNTFEAALSNGDEVTATLTSDGKYILNNRNNGTGTDTNPTPIKSQASFNQALANGETNFKLDITTGGLTINTDKTITINLSGTIAGGLTVNAPNAHINNSATITGGVNIIDVAGSSFINTSTITGDITITDSNARFVNTNGTLNGNIIISGNGTQRIALEGTSNNAVIIGANVTELILAVGSSYSSITANNASTKVKVGASDVTPGISVGKGIENATITSSSTDYQLTIEISDADLNKSASTAESFNVAAKYAGEDITLTFTETGVNTGKFQSIVNITKNGDVAFTYVDTTTTDGIQRSQEFKESVLIKADADLAAAKRALSVLVDKVELTIADKKDGKVAVGDTIKLGDINLKVYADTTKKTDVTEDELFVLLKDAKTFIEAYKTAKSELDNASATIFTLNSAEKAFSDALDLFLLKVEFGMKTSKSK